MTHFTRRRFLALAGAATAGVAVAGTLGASGTGAGQETRTVVTDGFQHLTVDDAPPSVFLGLCAVGDLTGDGRPDIVVGGKGPDTHLWLLGSRTRIRDGDWLRYQLGLADPTLYWYENRPDGWRRHRLAVAPHIAEGGTLADIDGDGRLDLVAGQSLHFSDLYWFECPDDPREEWTRHLVTDEFEMYHDTLVADVDDDGDPELVALTQRGETLFYYDIPDDPTVEPWPVENRTVVMSGEYTKGLAAADIDGDGRTELVAGGYVYHREADGSWTREAFAPDFEGPRVAIADVDGDGGPELVASEGDSPWFGTHPGRLAWFDRDPASGRWARTVLRDDLFSPHTLQVADFDGDGSPDIVVGEMGLGVNDDPKLVLYLNDGRGSFEERVISTGVPTHEGKVADVDGDGRPDIVGKSHYPDMHVDVWYNDL